MSVSEDALPISRSKVTAQVDRIFGSPFFCDSPTLQKLLAYLVEQALEGCAGNLKEYSIGAEVFQRGQEFDPQTDSIVRVQVEHASEKTRGILRRSGFR